MVETQPILLIGERRSGKSTFINSFCDYIHRNNFDSYDVKASIGLYHYLLDDEYNQATYFLGQSSLTVNEQDVNGQPSTKNIKQQELTINNQLYLCIDTPGIGDGRGARYDDDNINNIERMVNKLEKPPIVCVFIDSVSDRETTTFALKKTTELIEKIEYGDVYFIFTKTRRSCYGPGEKLDSIANVLPADLKRKLRSKDNVFCFDNEGFNYALMMSSYQVSDNLKRSYKRHEDNFRQSWKHSKQESRRFLRRLSICDDFVDTGFDPMEAGVVSLISFLISRLFR